MSRVLLRVAGITIKFGASLHISRPLYHVDKSLLAKLRKKSGFSISNCKKALEVNENDVQKAESWLQEQAQAQGWEKASKLQGRRTGQGLVGIHIEGRKGALLEVNCETDFVARNEKFMSLVTEMTKDFFSHASGTLELRHQQQQQQRVIKQSFSAEQMKCLVSSEDGKTLGDKLALAIGNIGENMSVSRGCHISAGEGDTLIGYCHPSPVDQDVTLGRYGCIMAINTHGKPLTHIAKQLCVHVIGMNPRAIGTPDDPKAENPDDEDLLYHQEFLSEPGVSVGEILKEQELEVVDYVRFETGEMMKDVE